MRERRVVQLWELTMPIMLPVVDWISRRAVMCYDLNDAHHTHTDTHRHTQTHTYTDTHIHTYTDTHSHTRLRETNRLIVFLTTYCTHSYCM